MRRASLANLATLAGAMLVLASATESLAAPRIPVRCRAYVDAGMVSQNVPMDCVTVTGDVFENVPDKQYLFVTDIILMPRLASQTTVGASVRIWQENGLSATGCSGGSVVGSFDHDVYISIADTSAADQVHIPFQTPYLILTPADCLAVYIGTSGGGIVELSGFFSKKPTLR